MDYDAVIRDAMTDMIGEGSRSDFQVGNGAEVAGQVNIRADPLDSDVR